MPRFLLALAVALTLALPAQAQQGSIGVGVSVSPASSIVFVGEGLTLVEGVMPSIYFPITMDQFRIEPEVGYIRTGRENNGFERSNSTLRIGTGVFYHGRRDGANAVYAGLRFGLNRVSSTESFSNGNSETESRVDYVIAPALGGEHYFGKLALGVEGQLQYTQIGNVNENSEASQSQLQTRALFFGRYYF